MLKKLALVLAFALSFGLVHAADINSASEADLVAINGIGPAKAKAIIAARQKTPFKSWADLVERIKGIGEKTALSMSKSGVTVGGQSYTVAGDVKKAASAAPAAKAAASASAPAAPAKAAPAAPAAPAAKAAASASAKK